MLQNVHCAVAVSHDLVIQAKHILCIKFQMHTFGAIFVYTVYTREYTSQYNSLDFGQKFYTSDQIYIKKREFGVLWFYI